ncbi:hypothetical protein HYH03_017157 [Edaphochlamys debaryana]|uniref:Uncharacterized protein n=1 Tax=Edaphochlamys debaryana TaxID=47281 RepID=A0A835XIG4_9CHLO|nr:hypothetical protein HYH03_017157 [Edaphochlamys debaryana]|eukprot:KAG2483990.1 hypothetical protein HYH03_017157 [Edaphochlamys debaryana]
MTALKARLFRQDFTIISIGTIFPLVFAIQQAFQRREEALREMAFLKSQASQGKRAGRQGGRGGADALALMGIYFCNRDWDISDGLLVRANLGNDHAPHAVKCAQLISALLTTLKQWLVARTVHESESERRLLASSAWVRAYATGQGHAMSLELGSSSSFAKRMKHAERTDEQRQLYYTCYQYLSQISVLNETLTAKANYPKAGEGGMSRLAQYLAKSTEALERLRYLREYRTPFMLRYVSFILILLSIILVAPYFAFMCKDSKWEDDRSGSCPAEYVTAIIYVLCTMTLYSVQVPCNVYFDLDLEFAEVMSRYGRNPNLHRFPGTVVMGNSVYLIGGGGGGGYGGVPGTSQYTAVPGAGHYTAAGASHYGQSSGQYGVVPHGAVGMELATMAAANGGGAPSPTIPIGGGGGKLGPGGAHTGPGTARPPLQHFDTAPARAGHTDGSGRHGIAAASIPTPTSASVPVPVSTAPSVPPPQLGSPANGARPSSNQALWPFTAGGGPLFDVNGYRGPGRRPSAAGSPHAGESFRYVAPTPSAHAPALAAAGPATSLSDARRRSHPGHASGGLSPVASADVRAPAFGRPSAGPAFNRPSLGIPVSVHMPFHGHGYGNSAIHPSASHGNGLSNLASLGLGRASTVLGGSSAGASPARSVVLVMDPEGGPGAVPLLLPDMPHGDPDSPTAQDAIEASPDRGFRSGRDLARGVLGHLTVSPIHSTPASLGRPSTQHGSAQHGTAQHDPSQNGMSDARQLLSSACPSPRAGSVAGGGSGGSTPWGGSAGASPALASRGSTRPLAPWPFAAPPHHPQPHPHPHLQQPSHSHHFHTHQAPHPALPSRFSHQAEPSAAVPAAAAPATAPAPSASAQAEAPAAGLGPKAEGGAEEVLDDPAARLRVGSLGDSPGPRPRPTPLHRAMARASGVPTFEEAPSLQRWKGE